MDLTPLGTNNNNGTTSPIDSIPVGIKSPEPTQVILPTDFPERNGKVHVPEDPYIEPSLSDSSLKNLIFQMIEIPVNQIKRNVIRRKSFVNTRNRTRQAHF